MMGLSDCLKFCAFATVVCLTASFVCAPAYAQDEPVDHEPAQGVAELSRQGKADAALDPNLFVGLEESYELNLKLRKPDAELAELKTIFFTLWQHQLLQEAKELFKTRPPEDYEVKDSVGENRERGIRELSLGGILFGSAESWIVWLNGKRITPDAIPKEVLDIRVSDEYIELKWYDTFTNLVFPIRLRPHQRFNLDSRMFLPGTSSQL